jgi:hypothetical protein
VRVFCRCPSETDLSFLYLCILATVYIATSFTSLQNYGGEQYGCWIYQTGRAVPSHPGYSGYTHSHCRDGQMLDDCPLLQIIKVSCNTGYQHSNCGDRTPHNTSGFSRRIFWVRMPDLHSVVSSPVRLLHITHIFFFELSSDANFPS